MSSDNQHRGFSGGARANVSFRAGLGARLMLGNGSSLTAAAVVDEARLTGNLLHDCVNGAGITTVLSARIGLAYELDLLRALR